MASQPASCRLEQQQQQQQWRTRGAICRHKQRRAVVFIESEARTKYGQLSKGGNTIIALERNQRDRLPAGDKHNPNQLATTTTTIVSHSDCHLGHPNRKVTLTSKQAARLRLALVDSNGCAITIGVQFAFHIRATELEARRLKQVERAERKR